MIRIGYSTHRDWDCYYDRPGEDLHHRIGIHFRWWFLGLEWTTHTPEVRG
jgi:hypothetical protein